VSCDICGQLNLRDQAALAAFATLIEKTLDIERAGDEVLFRTPAMIADVAYHLADEFVSARSADAQAQRMLAEIGERFSRGNVAHAETLASEYRDWAVERQRSETMPAQPVPPPAPAIASAEPVACDSEDALFDLLNAGERRDRRAPVRITAGACQSLSGLSYEIVEETNGVAQIRLFPAPGDWARSRLAYTLDEMISAEPGPYD